MKRVYLCLIAMLIVMGMSAQERQQSQQSKFSPEKFDADLQEFIMKEAHLTPQEAAVFFPVYKEMQQKMRVLFLRQRELAKNKPQDEEACRKAIEESDAIDIELKRILQEYHKRFFEILPASKVYDIIKAEERFHRRMMRNWGRDNNKAPQRHGQQRRHEQHTQK